ncbi:hypothetical protein JCM8547_003094 [Rhodosporidiobolus lusitaniae]
MSVKDGGKPSWACGKPTTSVCGACAKSVPPTEISFCARECQKIVWPIRKVFCGPGKTNPFILPPLSKEEADEAWANRNKQYPFEVFRRSTSLMSRMNMFGLTEMGLKSLIFAPLDPTDDPSIDDPGSQGLLALIRDCELLRISDDETTVPAVTCALRHLGSHYAYNGQPFLYVTPTSCRVLGRVHRALHRLSFLHYMANPQFDGTAERFHQVFKHLCLSLEAVARKMKGGLTKGAERLETMVRATRLSIVDVLPEVRRDGGDR